MNSKDKRALWLRWVAANAFGEMFGLGLTFAVGVSVISALGSLGSGLMVLVSFLVAVASGIIEATWVGIAQWWEMHPWFSAIRCRAWWLATRVGALLAYVMGYLPSTLMSLGEQTSQAQAPATEPAQWIILMLAAGLGIAGGAVLSFAQFLVMRKEVTRASLWIPANMLAWMVGMPIIFWSIDIAQKLGGLIWMVLFIAGMLLLVGMLVGAIHGAFLLRLAEPEKSLPLIR